MRPSDIALALDTKDAALLREISKRSVIYVHKSNEVLALLQHRLVSFVYDEGRKMYRVTLTGQGARVVTELEKKK